MVWSNQGRARAGLTRRVASLAALLCLTATLPARAQVGAETANSGAKGTVGGALLGAELVLVVEAAFDVDPWWAYLVGGGLGAAGGAVGGYFVDQEGVPAASMSFLVAGLVLSVPTTIFVLAATRYEPETNPVIDDGKEDYTRAVLPVSPAMAPVPLTPALSTYGEGGFRLGVPAISVAPVFRRELSLPGADTRPTPVGVRLDAPLFGMRF